MNNDLEWASAAEWLASPSDAPDLVVLGVPLSEIWSGGSSGAHATPAAMRARMARLSSYDSDHGIQLGDLGVFDAGNLTHQPSHDAIRAGVGSLPDAKLRVLIGGDSGITYPALTEIAGDSLSAWGLVSLDANHDVDPYEGRPGGSSVARALVDAGLPGGQIVQLGIGGFSNSAGGRLWCDDQGVDVITMAEARFASVEDALVEALDRLAMSVDHVYVNLDFDVMDRAFAPACRGAHPGGFKSRELLAAAFIAGRHAHVRAVDIVDVDATVDLADVTVDLAALCLLNVASGLYDRIF